MDQELLNKITISNCFDEVFYKDEWLKDKRLIKCPSNNKYMCKEFNKRNPTIPHGWFSGEDDEKYYAIEVRHARCEFNSDKFFEMKDHVLDQKRYFFLCYIDKCYDALHKLLNQMYEKEEEDLELMTFIVDRVLDVYQSMEIFVYHTSVKRSSFFDRIYRNVETICNNDNTWLKKFKEYLFYNELKTYKHRRNDVRSHYAYLNNPHADHDYCSDMYEFVERKVRVLGIYIKDLKDIYKNVHICTTNLCYCCFEINGYSYYRDVDLTKFKYKL